MKKMTQLRVLSILTFSLMASCMKQQSPSITASTDTATAGIGCGQMQSKIFDSMYDYLEQEKGTPDLDLLKKNMANRIDEIALEQKIQDTETLEKFKTEYNKVFDILISDTKDLKAISDIKTHLQTLIELEMQDQSTEANIKLNNKLSMQISKVSALSQELSIQCNETSNSNSSTSTGSTAPHTATTLSRMMVGVNNVFSTAYQSCAVLDVPVMTAATPDAAGISRVGTHPDGIGGKRLVTDLAAVERTHPYIRVAGDTSSSSCFNVYKNPLIYDYGGEPSITNNKINFFTDAGTGTTALGIDCSAYVSSSAAAGGLRYKPGLDNKAVFIRQTSAKFIDATASNFTCYKNITVNKTESIKPGDIAAVRGHVLIIDSVGADPFGLKRLSSSASCTNLDTRYFDFVVSQSSSVKNGVGIDKYVAKDYLNESSKMKALFLGIGKAACLAYFQNTSSTPKNADWGIIRHKGTPECLAPNIAMTGQSCVSQCQLK